MKFRLPPSAFRLLLLIALLAPSTACSVRQQTVVPRAIVSHEASFDGNTQNSGLVKADASGFVVTTHWIERYDALLTKHGERLSPPVKPGDRRGVEFVPLSTSLVAGNTSLPTYLVTPEVMVRFTRMNQWRKAE